MVLNFDVIVLIVTAAFSLFLYGQANVEKYLRYFPPFLFFVLAIELIGAFLQSRHQNNTLLYNLYSILEFEFYLYFYFQLILSDSARKGIRVALIVFPLICLVDIFLIQGQHTFHTYTFTLGSVIIDIAGIMYFFQLFMSRTKVALLKHPAFWINAGLIFFFTTSMSFLSVINYVSTLPKSITLELLKMLVLVNTLKYITFIIAILCRVNFRKSMYSI
jgi:hypothetical protein